MVNADSLFRIDEKFIFHPDSGSEDDDDPDNNLGDKLQCPAADAVLIAMRKAFTLTYSDNPFLEGTTASIKEIRRLCVDALKPMPDVLEKLQLPAIPKFMNDPINKKAQLYSFLFVPTREIDIRIQIDGKKQKFLDSFWHREATSLIIAARHVLSFTFNEAHDEDQYMEILLKIRTMIHQVLPAFNECLVAIEIEPIAPRNGNNVP